MDQDSSPQILCLEYKVFPAIGSNFQDLVGEQWQWQYSVLFGTLLHPSPDHQGFLLVYGFMGGEHYHSLWCNSIWKINIYDTQYNIFVFQLKIYLILTGWKFCRHVYDWCVWRSEKKNRAHGNGTTDGSGPSWELNLVLSQEEKML